LNDQELKRLREERSRAQDLAGPAAQDPGALEHAAKTSKAEALEHQTKRQRKLYKKLGKDAHGSKPASLSLRVAS